MIVHLLDLVSHFVNYDSGGEEDSSSSSDDDDLASSTVGTVKSDFGWDYPTITGGNRMSVSHCCSQEERFIITRGADSV